jgi:hypothetical protein
VPGPPCGPACGPPLYLCGCDSGAADWSCFVDSTCSTPTTLTGRVFDPAGQNPVYNVVVYIPEDVSKLEPVTLGTNTCNTCQTSIVDYVAATTTDETGSFTLSGVPTGTGVPVTVQLGKWRRTIPVDITNDCGTNTVSVAPTSVPLLRLPAKRSEGDLPQMALLTGGCDELGCFLTKVGIDPTEFTAPHAAGRVDVYQGLAAADAGPPLSNGTAGDCTRATCPLWSTRQALEAYDVVLLGCECGEHNETKPPSAIQAMHDWLDEGGKLLATHYQDTWFKNGPADFQGVGAWLPSETNGPTPGPFGIDTTTNWGMGLQSWLDNLGALNADGGLPLNPANVSASVSSVRASGSQWVYAEPLSASVPKILSFPTPVGGGVPPDAGAGGPPMLYCGQGVFTDVHAGGGGQSSAAPVPASCTTGAMSAEEKTLEFVFFNMAGGVCSTN